MIAAAYGGRTTSNPVYLAAVKRQQDKERERVAASSLTEGQRFILRIRAEKGEPRRLEEERWHREFQRSISELWQQHIIARAERHTNELVSMFRSIDVRRMPDTSIPKPTWRISAEYIIREGVANTPFTVGDIKGPRRTRQLVELRHALIAKVYVECPWLTLPQIGRAFGGRDHSSAWHAVKKMGAHHTQTGVLR